MHDLSKLKVWGKAMELSILIYKITEKFPKTETYGLVSQMRRCSVSVASNIAEGAGRGSKGEFGLFLGYSNGSSYELLTQSIIANKLDYIDSASMNLITKEVEEIQKMTFNLKRSLR